MKQMKAVWELLPEMNETPLIFFWIKDTEIDAKSEDLDVVNYIGLHVWTLALRGIYQETKLEHLLDSCNILNMFEAP